VGSFCVVELIDFGSREFEGIFLDYSRQSGKPWRRSFLSWRGDAFFTFFGSILENEIVLLFDNLGFIRFGIGCQAQGEDLKGV
jgi:hypothetical protein